MAGEQAVSEGAHEAILGKYRLIAKLGQGGMADVFLAVARGPASFNKLVVIKRHRTGDADGDVINVEMFLDEAKLSARLNHPNIVQTYEIGEEEGAYFIVMEYLDGQPLNRIMRAMQRGEPGAAGFTRGAWIRIVCEVLSGLHYAHELADYDGAPLNIVHRDVSPHNVFVTYDGAVKLVDFGIAKASLNSVRTETGILKGKASYMAPEQAVGSKSLDRRADIFPVGIVLWEILARRRLFEGDAVTAISRLVKNDIPRLKDVFPDVPPELDAIVNKALAFDPADRYATAQEMRVELDAYLRAAGDHDRGDDLAAKMLGIFGDRRAAIRKQVKACLDRAGTDPGRATLASGLSGPASGGPSSLSLPSIDQSGRSSTVDGQAPNTSSSTNAAVVSTGASKRSYVIGGVGALALASAVALVLFRPAERPPAVVTVTAAGSAPAAAGMVRVSTDPPEATVRWNGRELGKTPLSVDLPSGMQTLSLYRPDFQEETLVLQVPPGGSLERQATLRRRDGNPGKEEAGAPSATAAAEAPRRAWRGGPAPAAPATAAKAPETAAPAAPPPVTAAAAPAPPPTAAPAATPKIQVVDDGTKPMVKVNVVQ